MSGAAEDRVPPCDLVAEAACLSAIMLSATAREHCVYDDVAEVVQFDDFYAEAHRRIFEAMGELATENRLPDMVEVGTKLRERDRLAQVGGMAYLAEILDSAPAVSNVRSYALTVLSMARLRRMIAACRLVMAEAYLHPRVELIDEHATAMAALADTQRRDTLVHVKTSVRDAGEALKRAIANGDGISGVRTGIDRLDRVLTGMHLGDLTILAARPGMGKTALAMKAARHSAGLGHGVAVFSLEMPHVQLTTRMLAAEARVGLHNVRTGQGLTPLKWQNLANSSVELSTMPMWLDDEPGQTIQHVRSKIRRVTRELAKADVGLKLVVVDYLQLMRGRGDTREQEIAGIARGLKAIAKEFKVAVLALSQLNRKVEEQRGDKRPNLSHLRESGAIEQDADNVVFIYRDDYYNKESAEMNVAELIVGKQRNGPTATVKCRWDRENTTFENLADGEYENG